MATGRIILITIELTCTVFYAFLLYSSFYGFKKLDKFSRSLVLLMALCSSLMLVDAGAWYFDGRQGNLAFNMTRLCNFLLYLDQYLLVGFVDLTVFQSVQRVGGKVPKAHAFGLFTLLGILTIMLLISQKTAFFYDFDAANRYIRGPGLPFSMGIGVVCLVGGILTFFVHYPQLRSQTQGGNVLPIVPICALIIIAAIFIQMKFYGFSFTNVGISMSVMVFVTLQNRSRTRNYFLQQARLEQQEKELQQAQIHLLRSQIKPHFLFNSLAVIRSLCSEDVKRAIYAIDCFSTFLRRSIDVLDQDKLVPFSVELELIENYLFLEQQRFPDAFDVDFDLDETAFSLPALSLQPLVENCVKYGLRGREDHGTLYIGTTYENNSYIITITDNGIGFVPSLVEADRASHTGIRNVRLRLQLLVDGTLDVHSVPGEGTCYTVTIPDNTVD